MIRVLWFSWLLGRTGSADDNVMHGRRRSSFTPTKRTCSFLFVHCRVRLLLERGLVKRWQQIFWPNPLDCAARRSLLQLNLSDVQGVFLVLFGCLLLAVFIFILEKCAFLILTFRKHLVPRQLLGFLTPKRTYVIELPPSATNPDNRSVDDIFRD